MQNLGGTNEEYYGIFRSGLYTDATVQAKKLLPFWFGASKLFIVE